MELLGKISIVTGGCGEIGNVLVGKMLKRGSVVINLEKTASNCMAADYIGNDKYRLFQTDITDPKQVEKSINKVVEEYDKIDVLVNNAGLKTFKHVVDIDYSEWFDVINVNLNGAFNVIKAVLPHMKINDNGLIINMASKAGLIGYEKSGPYSASKSGLLRLTETLAREFKGSKISCCAVCPSTAATSDAVAAVGETNARRLLPIELLTEAVLKVMCFPEKYNGRCVSIMKNRMRLKLALAFYKNIYLQLLDWFEFRI